MAKKKINVVELRPAARSLAEKFVADIPPPGNDIRQTEFIQNLPNVLKGALALILQDIESLPSSSVVGIRLLAATINRLENFDS